MSRARAAPVHDGVFVGGNRHLSEGVVVVSLWIQEEGARECSRVLHREKREEKTLALHHSFDRGWEGNCCGLRDRERRGVRFFIFVAAYGMHCGGSGR